MVVKYNIEVPASAIVDNIKRITNLIFKMLPSREEGGDWETNLNSIIIEIGGMSSLMEDFPQLFSLLCKLEALKSLTQEEDFLVFRKTIFECLNLCSSVKEGLECQDMIN